MRLGSKMGGSYPITLSWEWQPVDTGLVFVLARMAGTVLGVRTDCRFRGEEWAFSIRIPVRGRLILVGSRLHIPATRPTSDIVVDILIGFYRFDQMFVVERCTFGDSESVSHTDSFLDLSPVEDSPT